MPVSFAPNRWFWKNVACIYIQKVKGNTSFPIILPFLPVPSHRRKPSSIAFFFIPPPPSSLFLLICTVTAVFIIPYRDPSIYTLDPFLLGTVGGQEGFLTQVGKLPFSDGQRGIAFVVQDSGCSFYHAITFTKLYQGPDNAAFHLLLSCVPPRFPLAFFLAWKK